MQHKEAEHVMDYGPALVIGYRQKVFGVETGIDDTTTTTTAWYKVQLKCRASL